MTMLDKNIEKEKRRKRRTWEGYYSRKTPTKRGYEEKRNRKNKYDDDYWN